MLISSYVYHLEQEFYNSTLNIDERTVKSNSHVCCISFRSQKLIYFLTEWPFLSFFPVYPILSWKITVFVYFLTTSENLIVRLCKPVHILKSLSHVLKLLLLIFIVSIWRSKNLLFSGFWVVTGRYTTIVVFFLKKSKTKIFFFFTSLINISKERMLYLFTHFETSDNVLQL